MKMIVIRQHPLAETSRVGAVSAMCRYRTFRADAYCRANVRACMRMSQGALDGPHPAAESLVTSFPFLDQCSTQNVRTALLRAGNDWTRRDTATGATPARRSGATAMVGCVTKVQTACSEEANGSSSSGTERHTGVVKGVPLYWVIPVQ